SPASVSLASDSPLSLLASGVTCADVVSEGGLEPPCPFGALAPQASASAYSATRTWSAGQLPGRPHDSKCRHPPATWLLPLVPSLRAPRSSARCRRRTARVGRTGSEQAGAARNAP